MCVFLVCFNCLHKYDCRCVGVGEGGLWYPLVIYEIEILVNFNTLNTFVVHFAQSLFYQHFAGLPEWDVCFITRGKLYFNR